MARFVGRNAEDKGKNRTPDIVGRGLVGAFCLLMSALASDPVRQFSFLCIAAAGIFAGQPVFWSLPGRFLKGAGAAAGIAAINSVGNLGGFVAQNVVPWIKDQTGSTIAPMFFPAFRLALAGVPLLTAARKLGDQDRAAWLPFITTTAGPTGCRPFFPAF